MEIQVVANEKPKTDIRALTYEALEQFFKQHEQPRFRAKQVYEWVWKSHIRDFEQMSNLPKETRLLLAQNFELRSVQISALQASKDGTYKIGFRLYDGAIIEGVLIPTPTRTTACISTQVGCQMGCKFCATAKLGLMRNLLPGEIFDQVAELNRLSKEHYQMPLSNIVVMGMGEPLANYDNTVKAMQMVSSADGLAMSPRRITVSTVGLGKRIRQLADDGVKFQLAVSLHAPTDEQRSQIMPVNRANSLSELSEAIIYFHQKTGQRVTFEYVLLGNFNDSIKDAQTLAKFCRIVPCKVNLIEYNATGDNRYQKSTAERTRAFMQVLEDKNMVVNLRRSRGEDIDAACGQLANQHIQKRF